MLQQLSKIERFASSSFLSALLMLAAPGIGLCESKPDKALAGGSPVVSRESQPGGHNRMKATILVHARPEIVWETVHEERSKDPDIAYAKVLDKQDDHLTLEEKFALLPVIGTAVCVMQDSEVPMERIDYRLIKSDHFKAMEGSWVLTSHDGGKSTILALSSYLDIGLPIPRMVLDCITSQKLQSRVKNVRDLAEKNEKLADKKAEL